MAVQSTGDVLARLSDRSVTLAVAESVTGGLLASAFVQVPGASTVFRGAVVAYATDLKQTLLQVDPRLLTRAGPVDAQVALQMAAGVAKLCDADLGLATTGVAGPDPQDGQPAGTVFVAVAGTWAGHPVAEVRSLRLRGGRPEIRAQAVTAALELLAAVTGG